MNDSTAGALCVIAFFTFCSIWVYVAYNTPDDTITFDSIITDTSNSKVLVTAPYGVDLWVGKNLHSLNSGERVIVKIQNGNGWVVELVR